VNQLGPAELRLRPGLARKRAARDRELVGPQLGIVAQRASVRCSLAGLKVNDDDPVLFIALEAVYRSPQPYAISSNVDLDVETQLASQHLPTGPAQVPADETLEGGRGLPSLALGHPGGLELQLVPDLVDSPHQLVGVGLGLLLTDGLGKHMDEGPEARRGPPRVSCHLAGKKPGQRAVHQLRDRTPTQPHRLVRGAHRLLCACQFTDPPPAGWIGVREQCSPSLIDFRSQSGQPGSGRAPKGWGGMRICADCPELAYHPRQGHRPCRSARNRPDLDSQITNESRWLVTVRLG
jgi:hypothetical protein